MTASKPAVVHNNWNHLASWNWNGHEINHRRNRIWINVQSVLRYLTITWFNRLPVRQKRLKSVKTSLYLVYIAIGLRKPLLTAYARISVNLSRTWIGYNLQLYDGGWSKNIIKAPLSDIFVVIKHWKWNGNLSFARHYNWVLGNLSNTKGEKVTCIQKIIVSDYNRLFSNISLALYSWKKR